MLQTIPRESLRNQWIRLGGLSAAFAFSVVFVQLPISLWAGNMTEFHSSPWRLLALGVGIVCAAAVSWTCLLWLLPKRACRVASSAACAIALFVWVQGNFVVGDMNVLNGQGAPVEFASGSSAWMLLVAVAVCVTVAWVVSQMPAVTAFAVALLTIGLYATTLGAIATSTASQRPPQGVPGADVYRFSTRENVLVVLLDGLESAIAGDILDRSPAIAHAFDGFQYFPDTAGVARTTFLSLPAIHSGAIYTPSRSSSAYFADEIRRRSFMNRFAAAGFDSILLNPVESVCPARVRLCATASELLNTPAARLKHESLQLLDLALFRISPLWLKRHVYRDGEWLTSGRMDVPFEVARVIEGNALLEQFSERITTDDGAPTLKFIHSLSTHAPYLLNDDCRTYGRASLEHLIPQARCGLLAVTSLLRRLRETRIYDNTLIVVMADHGIDPSAYEPHGGDEPMKRWRRLAGSANPVFLMKPQGSRGALQVMPDAVHVPDLGNMLCVRSRTCRVVAPVAPIKASPTRVRRFNDYEWRQEFWRLRIVDKLAAYEIRGPVLERSSWSRAAH